MTLRETIIKMAADQGVTLTDREAADVENRLSTTYIGDVLNGDLSPRAKDKVKSVRNMDPMTGPGIALKQVVSPSTEEPQ